jgi:hypothetical protein
MPHFPPQHPTVSRGRSAGRFVGSIGPSDCSPLKKLLCQGALLACAATCAAGGACAACFASLGMSSCIDCL